MREFKQKCDKSIGEGSHTEEFWKAIEDGRVSFNDAVDSLHKTIFRTPETSEDEKQG